MVLFSYYILFNRCNFNFAKIAKIRIRLAAVWEIFHAIPIWGDFFHITIPKTG